MTTRNRRSVRLLAAMMAVLALNAHAETVTYYATDHLGSPVAAMDAEGNVLWRESYTPYGEKRENPSGADNDTGYTGHQSDDVTGLTYMQARYYDPVVGRFMATDPVQFNGGNPQQFGRYVYANSDPFRYLDPDGQAPQAAGAVAGAIVGGIVGLVTGGMRAAKKAEANWQTIAQGAGVGLLAGASGGAIAGTMWNPYGVLAAGALGGGFSSTAEQYFVEGSVDAGEVAMDTAFGMVSSGSGLLVKSVAPRVIPGFGIGASSLTPAQEAVVAGSVDFYAQVQSDFFQAQIEPRVELTDTSCQVRRENE